MASVRLEKLAKTYRGGVGAVNDLINPATIDDRTTYPEPTREPAGSTRSWSTASRSSSTVSSMAANWPER